MRPSNRIALAAVVTSALVGLLVLVAIGARAGHPIGHARLQQRAVPARLSDDLLTLFVIFLGACLAFCLAGFAVFRNKWKPRESHWVRNFFLTFAMCILAGIIGYRLVRHVHVNHHTARQKVATAEKRLGRFRGGTQSLSGKGTAHFDWEFAAVLGGVALIGVAYVFMRREREDLEAKEDHAGAEEALAVAIRETIDDLRSEPDPRRAVIAAYARMEGVLARHGYPRRAAEAPYEYLQRVLPSLRVAPRAVAELTELFERAKFSPHRIDEEMRTRALNAFVSIRDELKAAA